MAQHLVRSFCKSIDNLIVLVSSAMLWALIRASHACYHVWKVAFFGNN